ncbi:MAG: hypothetical protein GYB66_01125, partial [Chloroflexi bacterium]|nr:hypothetical protein [Chloroflexota bacterium]
LVCTADLFNLWIWFETMVVSSYLMVAFYREQPAPLEAAVKYLVQSALGSVFVLLGNAQVLAETGCVNMETVRTALEPSETLLVAGALFVAGFGIKSALVPFHTWLPDAYSQSPSGVSAILAGVVTSAGLVTLLRALSVLGEVSEAWGAILMGFGILNVVIGNLLAFQQQQIKRLLAYSSLPHIGFMLIGLGVSVETGIPDGAEGSLLHLFNHGLMKGAAFLAIGGIVYGLRRRARERGALTISQMAGLVHRYPVVVTVFSIAVLGLAGIPPLAGFVSLFRIFGAGMGTAVTAIHLVVILAAINELLALGYYLPVVNAVILGTPSETVMEGKPLSLSITAPLVLLGAAILGIGIYPEALEWLVEPAGQVITSAFGG